MFNFYVDQWECNCNVCNYGMSFNDWDWKSYCYNMLSYALFHFEECVIPLLCCHMVCGLDYKQMHKWSDTNTTSKYTNVKTLTGKLQANTQMTRHSLVNDSKYTNDKTLIGNLQANTQMTRHSLVNYKQIHKWQDTHW